MTSWQNEKCATSEGWADFFATATYWPRFESDAWYKVSDRNLEGYTDIGNSGSESCVNKYQYPHRLEADVARFFWDVYDSTVLGNADSVDESFRTIFLVWDSFPSGYFNHNANELDSDGRNVKDYAFHADPANFNSIDLAALINSNCLRDQDDN